MYKQNQELGSVCIEGHNRRGDLQPCWCQWEGHKPWNRQDFLFAMVSEHHTWERVMTPTQSCNDQHIPHNISPRVLFFFLQSYTHGYTSDKKWDGMFACQRCDRKIGCQNLDKWKTLEDDPRWFKGKSPWQHHVEVSLKKLIEYEEAKEPLKNILSKSWP